MSLTLEVVGEKAARMGGAVRKTFTAGGTIGRLPDNDWILPDQYISGHHARISFANGVFTIEDTSTNGVFINSPQNRLTRKKAYPLRNGDTVFIDDYEVRVTVAAEPAALESYARARSAPSSGPLIRTTRSTACRGRPESRTPPILWRCSDCRARPQCRRARAPRAWQNSRRSLSTIGRRNRFHRRGPRRRQRSLLQRRQRLRRPDSSPTTMTR
jgi:type VI secretion system FHA domain protein